jgi:oxygen-independent coproporphyrinogen-3 oxidase
LGVSSISDAGLAFVQNDKSLSNYYADMHKGKLPIRKGYILNEEDQSFRQYIIDICCKGKTTFQPKDVPLLQQYSFDKLDALAADGLVEWNAEGMQLTSQGHYFLRNICSAFDLHLTRCEVVEEKPLFSKAI